MRSALGRVGVGVGVPRRRELGQAGDLDGLDAGREIVFVQIGQDVEDAVGIEDLIGSCGHEAVRLLVAVRCVAVPFVARVRVEVGA